MAGHAGCKAPASNLKKEIARILFEKGYILSYKVIEEITARVHKIKYNPRSKQPAIKKIERASRPGLRKYSGADDLPRVLNGLGIAIISTSRVS